MKLKYKSKVYDSEDIPLFLYFKTFDSKKKFINTLVKYNPGSNVIASDVYVAFAGNTIIKDKRSKLYYCIDSREEKNIILKSMYYFENNNFMDIKCIDFSISLNFQSIWNMNILSYSYL